MDAFFIGEGMSFHLHVHQQKLLCRLVGDERRERCRRGDSHIEYYSEFGCGDAAVCASRPPRRSMKTAQLPKAIETSCLLYQESKRAAFESGKCRCLRQQTSPPFNENSAIAKGN